MSSDLHNYLLYLSPLAFLFIWWVRSRRKQNFAEEHPFPIQEKSVELPVRISMSNLTERHKLLRPFGLFAFGGVGLLGGYAAGVMTFHGQNDLMTLACSLAGVGLGVLLVNQIEEMAPIDAAALERTRGQELIIEQGRLLISRALGPGKKIYPGDTEDYYVVPLSSQVEISRRIGQFRRSPDFFIVYDIFDRDRSFQLNCKFMTADESVFANALLVQGISIFK